MNIKELDTKLNEIEKERQKLHAVVENGLESGKYKYIGTDYFFPFLTDANEKVLKKLLPQITWGLLPKDVIELFEKEGCLIILFGKMVHSFDELAFNKYITKYKE